MFRKLRTIIQEEDKDLFNDYEFKKINWVTSKDNQMGKSMLANFLLLGMDYNNNFINKSLNDHELQGMEKLRIKLSGDKYIFENERKTDTEPTKVYSIEEKKYLSISRENKIQDYLKDEFNNWKKSIWIMNLIKKQSYFSEYEERYTSPGMYFQIIFIEQHIGWVYFNYPKVFGFTKYYKDTINLALFSIIDEKNRESIKAKLETARKDMESYVDLLKIKSVLSKETSSIYKSLLSELSSGKTMISNNSIINSLIKEIEKERSIFVKWKYEYSMVKNSFNKEHNPWIIGDGISIKSEKFTENTLIASFRNNEEIKTKLEIGKVKEEYEKSKVRLNDSIEKLISEVRRLSTDFEFKDEFVKDLLKQKNLDDEIKRIDDEIALKKSGGLSELFENINNELNQKIKNENEKVVDQLLEEINKQTNFGSESKSNIEKLKRASMLKGGALRNIQVLVRRIAIIRLMKGAPYFVVDSPFREEIEMKKVKIEEDKSIYSTAIRILINMLIKMTENDEINQLFIITNAELDLKEDDTTSIVDMSGMISHGNWKELNEN